ncbi:MAG: hypothetical protein OXC00_12630 [Acidimicrobiaceae bacterium]|nr:hypothetical protein [Acidimicrobiaceae bacterium]
MGVNANLRSGETAETVADIPLLLIGSPAEVADRLRERRERWGFSYIVLGAADADIEAFAPVISELDGE